MSCSALCYRAQSSSKTRSRQLQSPLFSLPAEVRIMIYLALLGGRILLIQMEGVNLFWLQGHEQNPRITKWGHYTCLEDPEKTSQYVLGCGDGSDQLSLAFLLTCWRVWDEAIELLYTENIFLFDRPQVFYHFYYRFAQSYSYASLEIRLNLYLTQYVIQDYVALGDSLRALSSRPGMTRIRLRINMHEHWRYVQSFCHFVKILFGDTDVQINFSLSPEMKQAIEPMFLKCKGITVGCIADFCEDEDENDDDADGEQEQEQEEELEEEVQDEMQDEVQDRKEDERGEEEISGSEADESKAGRDSEDEGSFSDWDVISDVSCRFYPGRTCNKAPVFKALEEAQLMIRPKTW